MAPRWQLRAWRVRVQRFEPAGQIARIQVRGRDPQEAWERVARQGVVLDPWALDRRGELVRRRRRRRAREQAVRFAWVLPDLPPGWPGNDTQGAPGPGVKCVFCCTAAHAGACPPFALGLAVFTGVSLHAPDVRAGGPE